MLLAAPVVARSSRAPGWAGSPDVPAALLGYSAQRLPRATRIAQQSSRLGHIAQATNPGAVAARDALLRAASVPPSSVILRAMQPVLGWTPPGWPPTDST